MALYKDKKCTYPGCSNRLFAKGYCAFHYRANHASRIKPYTSKRKKEQSKYTDLRSNFIEKERRKDKKRKLFCIFCGLEIHGEPSLHHALGRDNDMLLDERYWLLSHNTCHVHQYHSMSWKDLPWWDDYLNRIKHIDENIYNKELRRMSKNG